MELPPHLAVECYRLTFTKACKTVLNRGYSELLFFLFICFVHLPVAVVFCLNSLLHCNIYVFFVLRISIFLKISYGAEETPCKNKNFIYLTVSTLHTMIWQTLTSSYIA